MIVEAKLKTDRISETRAVLHFLKPVQLAGSAFKLNPGATILGREKGDILVNDAGVSSTHCQVQIIDQRFVVYDMNSTNGTFVNGQRILKQEIVSGDIIQIGSAEIRFEVAEAKAVRHIQSTSIQRLSYDEPSEKTRVVDSFLDPNQRNASWQFEIEATYPNGESELLTIHESSVSIGRGLGYGKFEQDPGISRNHLSIKINGQGEIFVEDQGSTNGSFLNGSAIKGIHLVRARDTVRLGATTLRLRAIKT